MIYNIGVSDKLEFEEATHSSIHYSGHMRDLLIFNESVVLHKVYDAMSHWPRWIIASVGKHFQDRTCGLRLFMEGMDHVEDTSDYIEVRIDGPYITELSKDYYRLITEVNIFVQSARNPTDMYRVYKDCGIVASAFNDPIRIFKYGTGVYDDQSLLGCMTLVHSDDQREALRVSHFGQYSATVPVMRSSVEGHFNLFLHEKLKQWIRL